jgi:hypothetical protein
VRATRVESGSVAGRPARQSGGPGVRGRPGGLILQSPGRARQDGIGAANGSPRADVGNRVASQPGRACMAARLAMTVQSGERDRSGTVGPDRATRVESASIRLGGRQTSSLERRAGRARLAGVTRLAAIRRRDSLDSGAARPGGQWAIGCGRRGASRASQVTARQGHAPLR